MLMLLSLNWLKKHLTLPTTITPQEIAQKLTLSTVEVENIYDLGADMQGVIVGRINAVEKHPNADRLRVCTVDVGNEKLSIVCGGSNVTENMLVAVAKIGARVRWHGEGDPIVLEPATIRGVASSGMICGADEIGLIDRFPKNDEKEIVDLTTFGYAPGTVLAHALGLDDIILEIDNKALSNRPDLWGHYGIAREIGALFETELKPYTTAPIGNGSGKSITVNIQSNACRRYTTVALKNITVTESPAWLKNALISVGINPINSIVDITNYVMLDYGQPLHAFDASSIVDDIINVRSALDGETIQLLDGKTYTLSPEHLLIATPGSVIGLAGIMGGVSSSIQPTTTNIVLESATFNPSVIRAGATKLGLRTDASMRFEKNLDPEACVPALAKAVELIKNLNPEAEIVGKPIDIYPSPFTKTTIEIPRNFFSTLLGTPIPEATAEALLTRLGFAVTIKKNDMRVAVPGWRATKDILTPEDVAEEIARLYGYDLIPPLLPHTSLAPVVRTPLQNIIDQCKQTLIEAGTATETPTYSFISAAQINRFSDDAAHYLALANPLSGEKPYLRRSLVPNLLEIARHNSAHSAAVRIFEIGNVFHQEIPGELERPDQDLRLPQQTTHLAVVIAHAERAQPFFDAKRILETLLHRIQYKHTLEPLSSHTPHHHPGRSAIISIDTTPCGTIYELHPAVADAYHLPWRTAVVEINLSLLATLRASIPAVQHVSPYPTVSRDIALLIDQTITYHELTATIHASSSLVTAIELCDHYVGEHIPHGAKSLTLRLTLGSPDHTLTNEEIAVAMKSLGDRCIERYNAVVR